MGMLLTWFLCACCIYITAAIVPGFKIKSFWSSFGAAFVIGFLNMLLKPILIVLTFPINFLTLGLFTFVVNACILKIAAKMLKNFEIDGWVPAIFGAIVLALVQSIFFQATL